MVDPPPVATVRPTMFRTLSLRNHSIQPVKAALLWVLAGLWLLLTGCIAAQENLSDTIAWVEKRHSGITHMDAADLKLKHTPNTLLLDVREPAEYAVSHLLHATRWQDLATTQALIKEKNAQRVVLYCSVGERSSRVAKELQEANPKLTVINLRGGIFSWAVQGRELVTSSGEATTFVHPYDAQWGKLLPAERRKNQP